MNKEFVPYQESLELKELGFDEPCFATYEFKKLFIGEFQNSMSFELCEKTETFPAPTFSQAFRWFREKHGLVGTPQYFTGRYYCYTINDMKGTKESNRLFTEFETYEEAELTCLKKLIEIVKQTHEK